MDNIKRFAWNWVALSALAWPASLAAQPAPAPAETPPADAPPADATPPADAPPADAPPADATPPADAAPVDWPPATDAESGTAPLVAGEHAHADGDDGEYVVDGVDTSGTIVVDDSLVEEDLDPSVVLFDHPGVTELRAGGLVQLHLAPWVGSDSLVDNRDPATRAGFRVRRASLGVEGRFHRRLRFHLGINMLETDEEVGSLSDAKLSYQITHGLQIAIGSGKVPFSRGGMDSSRRLPTIERPLSVQTITPSRRLGMTVEASFRRVAVLVAVMNGSEGFVHGNEFGGVLAASRIEVTAWGDRPWDQEADALVVGAGALYQRGPATHGPSLSVDATLRIADMRVRLEGLCDRKRPDEAPAPAPTVADELERCGAYGELGYRLRQVFPDYRLTPVARVEVFDDNRDLKDSGDTLLVSGGANAELVPDRLRLQLHYLHRKERYGSARANDAVVLVTQGWF